jgi:aminopeptidase N
MKREFALPGTRARYAPDRPCDIEHIKIDIDIDVGRKSIAGTCSLTISPIVDDLRWVRLDAVELDISSVSADGSSLDYTHDGKVLRIDLGRTPSVDESIVIDVDYSASPRRGLYFVGPDEAYPDKPLQVWTQGQDEDSRFWFPCFDSPHEKATSEVIATVPAKFFALSNGTLIDDRTDGDRRTMHWRFDTKHSAYLITLAAAELTELTDSWENVEVTYYASPGREEETRRTLGRTPEMLELFSKCFGVRYPYEKYAQVFVADFIFGGMENTTATTLTDVILLDERAAIDYDMEALVAHELAHQWFGDLLTCRDWGEGWLNEGFATYSEYIWREHAEGRDAAAIELEEWGEQYFGEDSSRYRRTIATKLYDEPIDIFDHHLYEKGGRVLHMLRRIIGDEMFWKSCKHYLEKHRLGSVETRDLARAVEDTTGRVLDWFFGQWVIEGAGHPELEVKYSWDPDTKLAQFAVKQTQKVEGSTPLFRVPLSVRFRIDGTDIDRDIEITETQQTFYFPLDGEPTQAIFDPGKHILAQTSMDKGDNLWLSELASATEAVDRIYAAKQLAKRGGSKALEALSASLADDPFWAVCAAAAEGLGTMRTDAARDVLISAIATEHPKTRRAVIRALGGFRRDEDAADALAAVIVHGDESYFVEAEACSSLGRTRSPRAAEVLRIAAERESFVDVIRSNAYSGLAEARDDSALELLMKGSEYGGVSHGRRAAVMALAKLAKGRKDLLARDVRERLEEYLRDPDFRVQITSVVALGTVGDAAAIPALQHMVDGALDGRLRRRSREVIRDLRAGTAQADELRALRDQVDVLRTESKSLTERVEKLEATNGKGKKGKSKSKKDKSKGKKSKDKKKKKSKK